ncbi:MAG: RidA family protein [Solirubrobacterales bacterium]
MRKAVQPSGVGPPTGSYSHAILAGPRLLHVSGQVGLRPDGELAGSDVEAQARQAFRNLEAVLHAAGCGFDAVVKLTAYLTDAGQVAEFARVRAEFIVEPFPASTVVVVAALLDPAWLLEVEAVAEAPA